MFENQHMLNVALKRACTHDEERAIQRALESHAKSTLSAYGLRSVRTEVKPVSHGTSRWVDVYMDFDPESFNYTVMEFIVAMTVMVNYVFVEYEPKGMCWWGLTATTDTLKSEVKA